MNKKEINEIRRRLNIDKNNITCVRGCYVNDKREIVSMFNRPLMSFPQEEAERYLALFRRVLSGVPGKCLVDIHFSVDKVMDGEEHALLSGMKNTALKVEEGIMTFYQKVIDSLEIEGNYLILLLHDAYDVPFRSHDALQSDVQYEDVFNYILCAVCPVKLSKSTLSYFSEDNDFHEREPEWIVANPELGFMFPGFDDRATDLYKALYYTRDASNMHDEFIDILFGTEIPMPAETQKETFLSMLEDTMGEELNLEVVQSVHEELRDRVEQVKADKEGGTPVISKEEVKSVLHECGVSDDHMAAFEERFDEEFGSEVSLGAQNLMDDKKFELRTPNVVIQVDPEHTDILKTQIIDGRKYIMISAEEGVMVNGLNISIH